MSWNPSAHAVIGVRLSQDDCYGEPITRKSFEHDYAEDILYHPTTGDKLWYTERPTLLDEDGDEMINVPGEYELSIIGDGYDETLNYYIGVVISRDADNWKNPGQPVIIGDVDGILKEIERYLSPKGLFEICKNTFGLHAVLS